MKPTTLRDYWDRIRRVLAHIQAHLDEPLDLASLAELAAFSPFHFHRIFRGMVGESVAEHVRRLRLERAAGRLKLSRDGVQRIALEAGYETHEAFSRAFRGLFGHSPTTFRTRSARGPANAGSGALLEREPPPMEVEICELEPRRLAFFRHVGPYDECGRAWDRLLAWAAPQGLLGPGALLIGVCHDDPEITAPERIRYDACLTVGPEFRPEGEFGVQTLPGGRWARTTHRGPYAELGETYARLLGGWLPRSGCRLRPVPCFEVYLNDPEGTEPEDLLTDIYAPLE